MSAVRGLSRRGGSRAASAGWWPSAMACSLRRPLAGRPLWSGRIVGRELLSRWCFETSHPDLAGHDRLPGIPAPTRTQERVMDSWETCLQERSDTKNRVQAFAQTRHLLQDVSGGGVELQQSASAPSARVHAFILYRAMVVVSSLSENPLEWLLLTIQNCSHAAGRVVCVLRRYAGGQVRLCPLRTPVMAMWIMALFGATPCRCFIPGTTPRLLREAPVPLRPTAECGPYPR